MLRRLFWILLVILIVSNIYVMVNGMKLANDISYFEQKTKDLRLVNIELEKKASAFNSYQYAASVAANLDFVKKNTPLYLDGLKYALNR